MTNNFEIYKEFIRSMLPDFPEKNSPTGSDKYYVIELIRRGKDNPDLPAANMHFKNYYLFSWHDFERFEDEIKKVCDLLRLRAYASVNWKSKRQVTLNMSATLSQRISTGDFNKPYNIWESCSADYFSRDNNVWVIDVDNEEGCETDRNYIDRIKSVVSRCRTKYEDAFIREIPTRSGLHLLYRPFDLLNFQKLCKEEGIGLVMSDVKKNHLTLLYENL